MITFIILALVIAVMYAVYRVGASEGSAPTIPARPARARRFSEAEDSSIDGLEVAELSSNFTDLFRTTPTDSVTDIAPLRRD